MNDRPKNIPASVYAKLANESRKHNKPFGEILQYYGIERFLYRLSKTQYADSLLLKGGLLFYGWAIPLRRVTRDIDFLSLLENRLDLITDVIRTAMSFVVLKDGIRFDAGSIIAVKTQVNADRFGIRATFAAYLGKAKIPLQIDFGFSDEISSKPKSLHYPSLLPELTGPKLQVYPVESVVAEKFHTMERFASIPSRWNDYYDIWIISQHFSVPERAIRSAVLKTFESRNTEIPQGRPFSLTMEFATRHQSDWSAFLAKSDLRVSEIADLSVVVETIWKFLEWPLLGLTKESSSEDNRQWHPDENRWR